MKQLMIQGTAAFIQNVKHLFTPKSPIPTTVEEPSSDCFRLFGFIAVSMSPRLFEEAIDSFDVLVRRDNSDYNAVSTLLSAIYTSWT